MDGIIWKDGKNFMIDSFSKSKLKNVIFNADQYNYHILSLEFDKNKRKAELIYSHCIVFFSKKFNIWRQIDTKFNKEYLLYGMIFLFINIILVVFYFIFIKNIKFIIILICFGIGLTFLLGKYIGKKIEIRQRLKEEEYARRMCLLRETCCFGVES